VARFLIDTGPPRRFQAFPWLWAGYEFRPLGTEPTATAVIYQTCVVTDSDRDMGLAQLSPTLFVPLVPKAFRSCLNEHAEGMENTRHHHVGSDADNEFDVALGLETRASSVRKSWRDLSVAHAIRKFKHEPRVVRQGWLLSPAPNGGHHLLAHTRSTRHEGVVKPLVFRRVPRRDAQNRDLAKCLGHCALVPRRPQEVAPGPDDHHRARERAAEVELGRLAGEPTSRAQRHPFGRAGRNSVRKNSQGIGWRK
jgi:hypothetical protein